MTQPRVSVIVSFLNAQHFLAEAVDSVIAQTLSEWELLLVDDGSTDTSTSIALGYCDRYPGKIRYLDHDGHRNHGQAVSRNVGLRAARANFVALLDADDVWLPNKLEEQRALLDAHREAVMVFGHTYYWYGWTGRAEDATRDFVRRSACPLDRIYPPPTALRANLAGTLVSPSVPDFFFRRDAVMELGGFEESFTGWRLMYEDKALLAKIFLKTSVYAADACWVKVRIHPDSLCATGSREGHETASREFYVDWLVRYLTEQHVSDPDIWKAARRMAWPFRHPWLTRLLRPAVRAARSLPLRRRSRGGQNDTG